MNTKLLKDMVQASITGSLKFPEIVGKLVAEGVESYHVDLVRSENRYYLPNGESHVEPVQLAHGKAAQKFSATQVEAAVRKSQARKINYPQFIQEILEAGCVYYITYLAGKRVTYLGRGGDFHTEFFPVETKNSFNIKITNGVPEIAPEELKDHLSKVTLIDVRRPDEFTGELFHIPGAKLVTLGPDLDAFLESHDKNDEMVFICRSGARSGNATLQSRTLGFSKTYNLQGGMILWNNRKYPVEK